MKMYNHGAKASLLITAVLFMAPAWRVAAGQEAELRPESRDETISRYGLDIQSTLESRIQDVLSPELLKRFERASVLPTIHVLTADERKKVAEAFAALPPVHRRILIEHLRGITFLDGMSTSGITWTLNSGNAYPVYDIAVRASVLRQTATEWLTEKERSVFSITGSTVTVSVEAGSEDAFRFLLLHESTHAVDFTLRIASPPLLIEVRNGVSNVSNPFLTGVWRGSVPVPAYLYPFRDQIRFYTSDPMVDINQAVSAYQALQKTPFVSLYGGLNPGDDLSESLAIYHWTTVMKQPYRVVVRDSGKEMFAFDPLDSDLVWNRMTQMKQFYADGND